MGARRFPKRSEVGEIHEGVFTRRPSNVQVTLEIPEGALPTLRKDPAGFVEELRLVAAIKWYEMRVCGGVESYPY